MCRSNFALLLAASSICWIPALAEAEPQQPEPPAENARSRAEGEQPATGRPGRTQAQFGDEPADTGASAAPRRAQADESSPDATGASSPRAEAQPKNARDDRAKQRERKPAEREPGESDSEARGARAPVGRTFADGDAHADRVVLLPTAYTHPAGTVYFSSYDIVGLQLGYAISDTTQVTVTGTPPLGAEHVFPLDITLKSVALSTPHVRVAAFGSMSGVVNFEENFAFLGRAGITTQLCMDVSCRSSWNIGGTLVIAGPALLTATAVGGVWRVSDSIALLGELQTLIPIGSEAGQYHGIAAAPGLRLPHRKWALDIALEIPLNGEASGTPIPLLVFTYRF